MIHLKRNSVIHWKHLSWRFTKSYADYIPEFIMGKQTYDSERRIIQSN